MALSDEPMTESMPEATNGDGAPTQPPAADVEATEQPQKELEDSLATQVKASGDVLEPGPTLD